MTTRDVVAFVLGFGLCALLVVCAYACRLAASLAGAEVRVEGEGRTPRRRVPPQDGRRLGGCMRDFESSSDPLPFTQVDRAVKQTAALIATRLELSFQHAIGGLVQFWELNGDPRDLEALLLAGKTEVVLSRDEVARRFVMAMGKGLDPDDLASLRLLERREDGYRVRGMSRYLKGFV